jgi:hypothetical protein
MDAEGEPRTKHERFMRITGRFPKQWDAYRKREEGKDGTPLGQITADVVLMQELAVLNIYTVESLAKVQFDADTLAFRPGLKDIQKKAAAYVQDGSFIKVETERRQKVEQELEAAIAKLEELQKKVEAQNVTTDDSGDMPGSGELVETHKASRSSRK